MKIKIYIIIGALWGIMVACDKSEDNIPSSDIINLSSISGEGEIELNWDYPEGENTIRYIEVRYFDPAKQKDVIQTVSAYSSNITIKETRLKYGEYHFTLQPFSISFAPGNAHEITEVSQRAPVINDFSSVEFVLTAEDVYVEGIKDSDPGNILDGNLETFINTDYSKPIGTVFWIDIILPKEQDYLKFSYINRNHTAASFPAEIECLVKAKAEDEWTLIKTLTLANDNLPTSPLAQFISKEYEAPSSFKYFRFRVSKTHTGNPNFSLAEFRVFDVTNSYFDPEAE